MILSIHFENVFISFENTYNYNIQLFPPLFFYRQYSGRVFTREISDCTYVYIILYLASDGT